MKHGGKEKVVKKQSAAPRGKEGVGTTKENLKGNKQLEAEKRRIPQRPIDGGRAAP